MLSQIGFKVLAHLLRDLSAAEPNSRRLIFVAAIEQLKTFSKVDTEGLLKLFPAVRLLLPGLDRKRQSYKLKGKQLSKLLLHGFDLDFQDALTSYTDPNAVEALRQDAEKHEWTVRVGDAASCLVGAIICKIPLPLEPESKVTIGEVNELLERLTRATKQEERIKWAAALRTDCLVQKRWTPWMLELLFKIILNEVKIPGTGEVGALNTLHPKARANYSISFSLDKALRLCQEGETVQPKTQSPGTSPRSSLYDTPPLLWAAFKPQLAAVCLPHRIQDIFEGIQTNVSDNEELLGTEVKWDGERLLLHVGDCGKRVETFSRNGRDTSWLYANPLRRSKLCETWKCEEVLLDAEVLPWHLSARRPLPFRLTKPTALGKVAGACLVFMIFDVIQLKTKDGIIDTAAFPLRERRRLLEGLLVDIEKLEVNLKTLEIIGGHRLSSSEIPEEIIEDEGSQEVSVLCFLSPLVKVADANVVKEQLAGVAARGEEGLMLKEMGRRYLTAARSGGWYKIKPRGGALGDSIDLRVVGAYRGSKGEINSFLMALEHQAGWFSFCKVSSGLSTRALSDILSIIGPKMIPWIQSPQWLDPYGLQPGLLVNSGVDLSNLESLRRPFFQLGMGEKPHYVLRDPDDALVMSVLGAEVITSKHYGAGCTFRFPRFASERWKEDVAGGATIAVLQSMRIHPEPKRRSIGPRVTAVSDVMVDFPSVGNFRRVGRKLVVLVANIYQRPPSVYTKLGSLWGDPLPSIPEQLRMLRNCVGLKSEPVRVPSGPGLPDGPLPFLCCWRSISAFLSQFSIDAIKHVEEAQSVEGEIPPDLLVAAARRGPALKLLKLDSKSVDLVELCDVLIQISESPRRESFSLYEEIMKALNFEDEFCFPRIFLKKKCN